MRVVVLLVVAIGAAVPRPGSADEPPVMGDASYHVSALYWSGGLKFPGRSSTFHAAGVRIRERDGIWAGGLGVASGGFFILAANSDTHKYKGSTYGPGYRIDWYERKSDEERQRDREMAEGMLGAIYYGRHQAQLDLYLPQVGISDARGFALTLMWKSWGRSKILEIGFPRLQVLFDTDEGQEYSAVSYGVPIRFLAPLGKLFYVEAEMVLGATVTDRQDAPDGEESLTSLIPFSLQLNFSPTERLFVAGGLYTHALGDGAREPGFTADAGFRF